MRNHTSHVAVSKQTISLGPCRTYFRLYNYDLIITLVRCLCALQGKRGVVFIPRTQMRAACLNETPTNHSRRVGRSLPAKGRGLAPSVFLREGRQIYRPEQPSQDDTQYVSYVSKMRYIPACNASQNRKWRCGLLLLLSPCLYKS